MSNRRELAKARRQLRLAQENLVAIESLPRRRGARVQWSNGVIWTRMGDDQWQPLSSDGETIGPLHPSEHVASFGWVAL